MSAAFKRDTGIQLNFLNGNTSEQSARMEAEALAKNLTIDVLIGGGHRAGPDDAPEPAGAGRAATDTARR